MKIDNSTSPPSTSGVVSGPPGGLLKPVDLSTQHLCMLIYGDNGAGKTHLACTMPGRKLYINAMGNPETLLKFPKDGANGWEAVEWPLQWSQMQRMFIEPILDQFPVLIADNLTGVYRLLLEDSMRVGGRISPEIQDYGLTAERLRWICSQLRLRRKKQHVIAICHPMVEKDAVTDSVVAGPSMPGKVPAHITSLFPEFCYMEATGGGRRVLHFVKAGLWPAATRVLKETKWTNATLAELYRPFLTPEEQKLADQIIQREGKAQRTTQAPNQQQQPTTNTQPNNNSSTQQTQEE